MAIRGEGGLRSAAAIASSPSRYYSAATPAKPAVLAAAYGGLEWNTNRDTSLADPDIAIYFDASATGGRPERDAVSISAGQATMSEVVPATNTTAWPVDPTLDPNAPGAEGIRGDEGSPTPHNPRR